MRIDIIILLLCFFILVDHNLFWALTYRPSDKSYFIKIVYHENNSSLSKYYNLNFKFLLPQLSTNLEV